MERANNNIILQWNCRGFYANISDIREITSKYNPAIMSLQELILGQRKLSLRGYRPLYSFGRGGAGLLIRNDIPHSEIRLRTTIQAVAAKVYIDKQYTVCSIYLPPNVPLLDQELGELMDQLPGPLLLLGDCNARDPTWGDTVTNPRAAQIKRLLNDYNMNVLNADEYTHYHIQTDTYSCIDLSIISSTALIDFDWRVITPTPLEQYNSDHYPIVLTKINQNSYPPGPPRWNLKRARWIEYTSKSEIREIPQQLSVNEFNQFLTNHMLNAAQLTIPRTREAKRSRSLPFWNSECEDARRLKQRLLRRWQRTRLLCDKIDYNRAKANERRKINEASRNYWKDFVSTLNSRTPCAVVFKRVQKISGKYKGKTIPVIKNNGVIETNPEIVAEVIGDNFASFSSGQEYSPAFQAVRARLEQNEHDFEDNEAIYNNEFTLAEMREALRKCKDTSPGPDEIHYAMIRNLHPTAMEYALRLFNQVWNEGKMPDMWRTATVIPIKKNGKDGLEPTHYRPISLTSCLCKLMERMSCNRLQWFLEKENTINPFQFGFRKRQSTVEPLLRLEHDIGQAFTRKRMIMAVSFDLEKAYDTTWKWGLLDSLHKMGMRGRLPKYIADFLKDRKIRVQVGKHLSEEKELPQGLPQGAVQSCELFKIAINGITSVIPKGIQYSLYVDDLLVYVEGGHVPAMERRMQLAINQITQWADSHGYRFSRPKTHAVLFGRRGTRDNFSLKLYNEEIESRNHIKFLGLTWDSRLTWSNQMKNLRKECETPLKLLRHISHLRWGADKKTLTRLYQALIQSKIKYACEIFCRNEKISEAVSKIQNEALRIISGAFKSSPIRSLEVDCGIMPLQLQVLESSCRHYIKLKQESQCPIRDLVGRAFEPHSNSTWGFRREVQGLLGEGCEDQINVLSFRPNITPPWIRVPAEVCEGITTDANHTSPITNAMLFREHDELHKEYLHIYTDGSKTQTGVGTAVVIPTLSMSNSRTLPKEASIYTAEAAAIILALELIDKLPKQDCIILSDSRSILTSLKQFEPKNPLIKKIRHWVHFLTADNSRKVKFCWIPAHCGLLGNEAADTLAKTATTQPPTIMDLPYTDYQPEIRKAINDRWQSQWETCTENKLHSIRPSIRKWESSFHKKRRYETIMTRLRIGHCNFSHVHLMKKEPQPICCGVPLTVQHALTNCTNGRIVRDAMYPEMRTLNSIDRMKLLLSEDTNFNIEKLTEYLRKLDILDKI